jgi:hypothetical protein
MGMYRGATQDLRFSTNSGLRFQITNSFLRSFHQHRFIAGTAGAPSMAFADNTNMGMYRINATIIGWSVSGSERMRLDSSNVLRIPAGGSFRIGSTTDSGDRLRLHQSGNSGFIDWGAGNLNLRGGATTSITRLTITSNGAMGLGITSPTNTAGRFEASNDIVAFASSDIRWKTNITPIESPLQKVLQLNGVKFDWIEDIPVHGNKGHDVGVIAQEVEKVLPEIVDTRDSGMKAVKYEKLIPLLIEGIKELTKKVETLEETINQLNKLK